jgi:hypothetical protein
MYADAALAAVLDAQVNPLPESSKSHLTIDVDRCSELPRWDTVIDYAECVRIALVEVCGQGAEVTRRTAEHRDTVIEVRVDGKTATVDTETGIVQCSDQLLYHLLVSVCQKTVATVTPVVAQSSSSSTVVASTSRSNGDQNATMA